MTILQGRLNKVHIAGNTWGAEEFKGFHLAEGCVIGQFHIRKAAHQLDSMQRILHIWFCPVRQCSVYPMGSLRDPIAFAGGAVPFHAQTVNSYHSHMKAWINGKFRGVATKYLPNYVAWQRLLTWFKQDVTPGQLIASSSRRQLINT